MGGGAKVLMIRPMDDGDREHPHKLQLHAFGPLGIVSDGGEVVGSKPQLRALGPYGRMEICCCDSCWKRRLVVLGVGVQRLRASLASWAVGI